MSIIIKKGEYHPLAPTNITHGKHTILQNAIMRMFPKTNKDHFHLLRSSPGDEMKVLQEILTRTRDTPLIIRDDRGGSIVVSPDIDVVNPPDDFLLAMVRNIAIAYEESSRRSSDLKEAIVNMIPGTRVLYINPSERDITSFLYDGHKSKKSEKLVQSKRAKFILQQSLERAREAIISEQTTSLSVLTPAEAQEDIIELLREKLKVAVVPTSDGTDWEMELTAPVPLHKLYPYAFLTNRGYLRATHPSMLLPDDSPNQIIRHIESIGKTIAQSRKLRDRDFFGEIVSSAEMREYIDKEDIPITGSSTIIPVSGANPYEMRSSYLFNRMRPKLNPVV